MFFIIFLNLALSVLVSSDFPVIFYWQQSDSSLYWILIQSGKNEV